MAYTFDALIDSGWMSQSLFGLSFEVKDSRIVDQGDFVAQMFLKAVAPSVRLTEAQRKSRLARGSM